jgi:hypothetical protein
VVINKVDINKVDIIKATIKETMELMVIQIKIIHTRKEEKVHQDVAHVNNVVLDVLHYYVVAVFMKNLNDPKINKKKMI